MIKANKGKIDFDGTEAVLVAETMCLLKSFTEHILIPKWGSKERATFKRGVGGCDGGLFGWVQF